MSRSAAESGSVLSFTFLDVLTCTMGTLVLLLVVLGERAKRAAVAEALAEAAVPAAVAKAEPGADRSDDRSTAPLSAEEAAKQLAEVQARQAEMEKVRAQAAQQLRDEQARVSHLEEHERRLEHELAQLHVTLSRLDETEQKQRVDQEAAERNLERLKALALEAEQEIEETKSEATTKRSYAIVPYKGANGTYRRPIYIECTKEAVIIQPEGIRLTAADFDGPLRSGNPLAAAIRAAKEELNSRVAAGGEGFDPYPLLVVRPDGAAAYTVALSAISSWDAEFGYEFVDADWDLEFPAPDTRLGEVMAHAVDQARARQELLAKVAPRRYGSRLQAGGQGPGGGGSGEGDGGTGDGFDELSEGGPGDRIGQNGGEGAMASGSSSLGSGVRLANRDASASQQVGRYGEKTKSGTSGAGGDSGGDFAEEFSGAEEGMAAAGSTAPSGGIPGTPGGVEGAADASGAAGHGQPASKLAAGASGSSSSAPSNVSGAEQAPDVHAAAPMAPNDVRSTAAASSGREAGTPSKNFEMSGDRSSEAQSRGANWANTAASQNATAITRPIQVAVRTDEIIVMADEAAATTGKVVSFHQPKPRVMDELAATVQAQVNEWGLAGRSMYWRPMLVLQVAPGAERQAMRLTELLKDSGLDVRMPQQTATRPSEEAPRAR